MMLQLVYILCSLVAPTLSVTCISKSASQLQWTSTNKKIYLNDAEFKMKGLSWFGFETDTMVPHGLATWANGGNSYTNLLDWVKQKGFNAIRLPFSQDMVNSNDMVASWNIDASGNSVFTNKTPLQCMDIIIDAAAERGILIQLDFHSKSVNAYRQGMNDIGLSSAKNTWVTLAERYKTKWNIFMTDMYNEPHDVGNNGDSSTTYTWNDYINWVQDMANALLDQDVNWLFGVQGTNDKCNLRRFTDKSCYWGENLQGVKPYSGAGKTVVLNQPNRFVWLPHVYGPEISANGGFGPDIWQDHWGYLCDGSGETDNQAACIVGEFGTKTSFTWLSTLIEYLKTINSPNTYFWCLNPDSGDTGGLLKDDWKSDETEKLNYLNRLQPNPTVITVQTSQICLDSTGDTAPGTTSTTTTTTSSSGESIGGRIKITNQEGVNSYWYAVVLSDIPSGVAIDWVKMRDGRGGAWETGIAPGWASGDTFEFNGNPQYRGPFSFKIKAQNGVVVENANVVQTIDKFDSGYMSDSSAFTETDTGHGLHWTAVFAIVIVMLCFVGVVIGGVCYFKRKKPTVIVSADDDDGMDTPVGDDGGKKDTIGYDMTPLNKQEENNEDENNEDENNDDENNEDENNEDENNKDENNEEEVEMEVVMQTNE